METEEQMRAKAEAALRAKAGKVQSDPAVTAIQEMSEAIATSFEVNDAEKKEAAETAAAETAKVAAVTDTLKTEMIAGFKVQGERINAMDRRTVALGISGGRDLEDLCLAALTDDDKKHIAAVDRSLTPKTRGPEPIFGEAIPTTLAICWMQASALLQKRAFSTQAQETALYERMDGYEKALCEFYRIEKAATLTTGTDLLGGHWIPDPVAAVLYRQILDNSIISPDASHVPMTTKTLDLPIEGTSALEVSWGTENTTITDSVPANALNKIVVTAERLNGYAESSLEAIQDSPISILTWVQTKLTEQAGRAIDIQALEGDGNPFTGLSDDAGVNEIASGANGDVITYQRLVDIVFEASERESRIGAKFYCSPKLMRKIVGLVDDNNMPVVQFGHVPDKFASSILGFPVEVHSAISAARTWGTGTTLSHLYFGPPSAIVIGDRVGMAWDTSDQPGFRAYQLAMRLVARLGIAISVPKAFSRAVNLQTT